MFSIIKSGMETAMHELAVISNNISNANSNGFKKSLSSFSDFAAGLRFANHLWKGWIASRCTYSNVQRMSQNACRRKKAVSPPASHLVGWQQGHWVRSGLSAVAPRKRQCKRKPGKRTPTASMLPASLFVLMAQSSGTRQTANAGPATTAI